jgi:hypothetical protein
VGDAVDAEDPPVAAVGVPGEEVPPQVVVDLATRRDVVEPCPLR